MLNAKQMADEIRAYRLAKSRKRKRFPCWHAADTALKTRPIRLLWPNPVALSESELWVQTRNFSGAYSRIVETIDLTAPDADARLARYDETASA